jgi:hypothetical protein
MANTLTVELFGKQVTIDAQRMKQPSLAWAEFRLTQMAEKLFKRLSQQIESVVPAFDRPQFDANMEQTAEDYFTAGFAQGVMVGARAIQDVISSLNATITIPVGPEKGVG